jgi:hypothetical protein
MEALMQRWVEGSCCGKKKGEGLAHIAIAAKTGGHFDDVIALISKMIATLREEEH